MYAGIERSLSLSDELWGDASFWVGCGGRIPIPAQKSKGSGGQRFRGKVPGDKVPGDRRSNPRS